jgi:hypothetical protein
LAFFNSLLDLGRYTSHDKLKKYRLARIYPLPSTWIP